MKRSCKNCKAFMFESFTAHCLLGHKIQVIHIPTNMGISIVRGKPLEPCEKPMTNDQYLEAKT
jgi:hypothetical protein